MFCDSIKVLIKCLVWYNKQKSYCINWFLSYFEKWNVLIRRFSLFLENKKLFAWFRHFFQHFLLNFKNPLTNIKGCLLFNTSIKSVTSFMENSLNKTLVSKNDVFNTSKSERKKIKIYISNLFCLDGSVNDPTEKNHLQDNVEWKQLLGET